MQIKPLRWGYGGPAGGDGVLEEALLIVKWGGVLTHAGRQQAEELGRVFRMVMYPRRACLPYKRSGRGEDALRLFLSVLVAFS